MRLSLLGAILAFLVVLSIGTIRRWRWTFWLVVVAFAAGVIRIPASALQIAGVLPLGVPLWYAILQAVIGIIQVLIAIVMIRAYRRGGVWAA